MTEASSTTPLIGALETYRDVNVYCGPYPYRPLPASTPEALLALLDEAGIETAIVTPFPALFHNRAWRGLVPWLDAFPDHPRIRFWAVVNPALPGWQDDLDRATERKNVAGIRLFPRCHGYGPFASSLNSMLALAASRQLAVCLTGRLLDDRLYPRMFHVDPPMDTEEVGALLKQYPEIRWVLNGFYLPEIKRLSSAVLGSQTSLVDIGICKPFDRWWESLATVLPASRLVVGSGAPLYYHAGMRLSIHRAGIGDSDRGMLLRENARRMLGLPPVQLPEKHS